MSAAQGPRAGTENLARTCCRILWRDPWGMFGPPAVVYAVCQAVGLAMGVRAPGAPEVVNHRQVAVGAGGVVPWSWWLLVVGVGTAIIVGFQVVRADSVLRSVPVSSHESVRGAIRGAGAFGLVVLIFIVPIGVILLTPGYWLYLQTTYSGSDIEDMRAIGYLYLFPFSAVAVILTPVFGRYFTLAVPVAALGEASPARSLRRSFQLTGFTTIFGELALTAIGTIAFAVILIWVSGVLIGGFGGSFAVGVWIFLVVVEPVHVAMATVFHRRARRKETPVAWADDLR